MLSPRDEEAVILIFGIVIGAIQTLLVGSAVLLHLL